MVAHDRVRMASGHRDIIASRGRDCAQEAGAARDRHCRCDSDFILFDGQPPIWPVRAGYSPVSAGIGHGCSASPHCARLVAAGAVRQRDGSVGVHGAAPVTGSGTKLVHEQRQLLCGD